MAERRSGREPSATGERRPSVDLSRTVVDFSNPVTLGDLVAAWPGGATGLAQPLGGWCLSMPRTRNSGTGDLGTPPVMPAGSPPTVIGAVGSRRLPGAVGSLDKERPGPGRSADAPASNRSAIARASAGASACPTGLTGPGTAPAGGLTEPDRARRSSAVSLRQHCAAGDLPAAFDDLDRLLDAVFGLPVEDRAGAVDRLEDEVVEIAETLCPSLTERLRYLAFTERAKRPGQPNRFQVQTQLETMLIAVFDTRDRLRPKRYRDFQDLLNAIERRRAKAFSLTEAAAFLSLTPGHLSKKFKATTGHSFVSYVMARRLRRARLLLVHTDLPVLKVAAAVDFKQANYFARVFRAESGMSPAEYRQTTRAGQPAPDQAGRGPAKRSAKAAMTAPDPRSASTVTSGTPMSLAARQSRSKGISASNGTS